LLIIGALSDFGGVLCWQQFFWAFWWLFSLREPLSRFIQAERLFVMMMHH
jgi:hypothetical protein